MFIAWKFYRVGYQYGVAVWNSSRAFSFLKDWLPAVVGVLVGVVPGAEWERKMKIRYRFVIVIVGFVYSGILWHSETLSDAENTTNLTNAIGNAVGQANAHSNTQFDAVQKNVEGVDKKVSAVGESLSQTTTALSTDIQKTSDAIQKTSDRLDASIGKVGKPDPVPPPRIMFTLSDTPLISVTEPITSETIHPNEDGTFSFKFNVINTSDVPAEEVEVWLVVCHVCEFVGEPKGSDHPPGEMANMRHFVLGSLHAGVGHGDTVINFKSTNRGPFGVTLAYACKTCGKPQPKPDYILNVDYSYIAPKPQ